jgi:hypothetical protein
LAELMDAQARATKALRRSMELRDRLCEQNSPETEHAIELTELLADLLDELGGDSRALELNTGPG